MPVIIETTITSGKTETQYRLLTTSQSDGSFKTIIHRMNKVLGHNMIVYDSTFKTKKEALSVHADYVTLLG